MQNKKFVGSDTSCKCLFAEQTLCSSVQRRRWGSESGASAWMCHEQVRKEKLPPSFCLCPRHTKPHVPRSLQVCMSNNHHFSCFLYSVILCSFHPEKSSTPSRHVPLLGMRTWKNLPLLKSCRGKVDLTQHRFLNLPVFLCEGRRVKVLLCCSKTFSSLPKSMLKPHFYYTTCGFFLPLISILPDSTHYRMRKYWE